VVNHDHTKSSKRERGDSYNGYQEEGREEEGRQEEEVTKKRKSKKLSMSSKLCPVVKRGIAFLGLF
jgi:hypothetical protein